MSILKLAKKNMALDSRDATDRGDGEVDAPSGAKKKKPVTPDGITQGGLTPLGREAKDSLQKRGVGSALRTVARGIGNEVTGSFQKKKPLVLAKKSDPITKPDLSALPAAANAIAGKNKNKLKRMSQQITRGTPAANQNPFKR